MKKVAVMNDLSGFGKCSLTAAIPVLSVMGIQCCPIPSAVLTNQSEYDYYHSRDLTDMIPAYVDAWKQNGESFDAIYSGYMTGAKQISLFQDFVDAFYDKDTFLLVDPVMGDEGETYSVFDDGLLDGMKALSKRADIITPNLTEACLLAGKSITEVNRYSTKEDLLKLSDEVGQLILEDSDKAKDIVITGIKCIEDGNPYMINYAITGGGSFTSQVKCVDVHFSGTGDLFASVLCGSKLSGLSTEEGMKLAGKFIFDSIEDTIKDNSPSVAGVNFEKFLIQLIINK